MVPRFANDMAPDRLISFTRLIQSLPGGDGQKCFFQNDVHLLFHEHYGNWHAWRFLFIFEKVELVHDPKDL